jgi:hypothetical protein
LSGGIDRSLLVLGRRDGEIRTKRKSMENSLRKAEERE